MRPKHDIQIDYAVQRLRGLVMEGRNCQSGRAGGFVEVQRDQFLRWEHDVERILFALFTGVRLERVQTERFWRIHSIASGQTARPFELISDEIDAQVAWLSEIADSLEKEAHRIDDRASTIAVADTHVLLHYVLFDEVRWTDIVGAARVRLAIPLRVIDELDLKKASRGNRLVDRARTVLAHLEQRVGTALGAPAQLRDGVTVEISRVVEVGQEQYRPPTDADTEILDTCESLALFSGGPAKMITSDYGMRLRANARSIEVIGMPDELRLNLDLTNAAPRSAPRTHEVSQRQLHQSQRGDRTSPRRESAGRSCSSRVFALVNPSHATSLLARHTAHVSRSSASPIYSGAGELCEWSTNVAM